MSDKKPLGPAQPRKLPTEEPASTDEKPVRDKVYGAGKRDGANHGSDDYRLPPDEQKAYSGKPPRKA